MIPFSPATRIYLATGATDLRKGFEGLSDLAKHQFQQDPLSGHLFVFANRRHNRVKLLYSDTTGTWLCTKRLYRGCYAWPQGDPPGALQILTEELTLLLSGLDLEKTRVRPWWRKAA